MKMRMALLLLPLITSLPALAQDSFTAATNPEAGFLSSCANLQAATSHEVSDVKQDPSSAWAKVPQPEIPQWCRNKNSQYCTYAWDAANGCCYATYTAPGAYCGTVCL